MSHACQRFWNCYKTLTFCSLLTRCTIPSACHAKRHLNLQKWFEHVFLNILTCKRTSRRNGVHFFIISTSKSGPNIVCFVHFDLEMSLAPQRRATFYLSSLRTRGFSEPTFWPSGATNHWKNTVFRDFPTFSRTCVFFLLTLSLSLTLPTSAFPSVHIVGSLTSELPSVSHYVPAWHLQRWLVLARWLWMLVA